jgi:hypothetical protein
MQHRMYGPPHRPALRISSGHAARAHVFVPAQPRTFVPPVFDAATDEDADYLNASPVARFVLRLLMRFF